MTCGCGCDEPAIAAPKGLGGASPRAEAILADYVGKLQASGRPWYVAPYLKSGQGLGNPLMAIAAIATTVASVAGTARSLKKTDNPLKDVDAIAANITPLVKARLEADGVQLPNSVIGQMTSASLLDAFGPGTGRYVVLAGGTLALIMLVKALRGR